MQKKNKIKLILSSLALAFFISCAPTNVKLFTDASDPFQQVVIEGSGKDKVLLLSLDGVITNQAQSGIFGKKAGMVQDFVSQLRLAEKDPDIKAVLLRVDSPGGTITASDIIYHELSKFKEKKKVKIVTIFMDVAASGGYYVALPSDYIFSHPSTVTGSIGAIFVVSNVSGLITKLGVSFNVKKSGRNKDIGSPYRKPTEEEDKILQGLIDEMGKNFIGLVKKHRNLTDESIKNISTARIYTASQAKKLGLVDRVGYMSDALAEVKEMAALPNNSRLVTYRREYYPNDNMYNVLSSHMKGEKLFNIELYPRIKSGLYYIWLPEIK